MISIEDSFSQDSSSCDEELQNQQPEFMLPQNENFKTNPFFSKLKGGKIKSIRPIGHLENVFESYLIQMTQAIRYFCICYLSPHSSIFKKIPEHITSVLVPYDETVKTEKGVRTYEIYELDQNTTPVQKVTTSEAFWMVWQLKVILEEISSHKLYAPIINAGLCLRRGSRLFYCGRGCIQEIKKEELKGSQQIKDIIKREALQLKQVAGLLQKWLNGRGSERIRTVIEMVQEERTKPKHFYKSVNNEIQFLTQDLWIQRLQKGVPDSFILPTLIALQQFKIELCAPYAIQNTNMLISVQKEDKQSLRQIIKAYLVGMLGQAILNNKFSELASRFYFQLKCLKHSTKQIDENEILAFFRYMQKIIQTENNTEKALKSCLMRFSVDSHFINAACDLIELHVNREGPRLPQKINDLQIYTFDAFGYEFDLQKYDRLSDVKSQLQTKREVRVVKIKEKQHMFGVVLPTYWRFTCTELIYFEKVEGEETPCQITTFSESDHFLSFLEQTSELSIEDRKESINEEVSPKKGKSLLGKSKLQKLAKYKVPKPTIRQSSDRWKEMFKSQEDVPKIKEESMHKFEFKSKKVESRILISSSVRPKRGEV